MPKDQRVNSLSINRAKASPYPCSLRDTGLKSESSLPIVGDEKEWEEARCPICMEHPHNAVLLLCSSLENGCKPYMCDTSYRHSNCLDQFCKSSAAAQSTTLPVANTTSGTAFHIGRRERAMYAQVRSLGNQPLVCPLCRGQIEGCIVVEAARRFMNSKPRSCSLETCNFTGTYNQLREHARQEHPSFRPSETDPRRESEWRRLQLQREFGDTLSAYQSQFGDDFGDNDILTELPLDGGLFNVLDGVHSQAEDEWSDDNDFVMDLELEFSFSFLNELPLDPWAWDDLLDADSERISARSPETRLTRSTVSSNYYREGSNSRQSTDRQLDRRSRSSTMRPNYDSDRSASRRRTDPSARRNSSRSRSQRWHRGL